MKVSAYASSLYPLLSNRILHLIVLPTEQCNFRCTYCYEDFSQGRMKQETVLGIKALLKKRASELNYLKLSWFGGEPLTANDIVLDISAYANGLADRYPGMNYSSEMTTNGYFLNCEMLVKLSDVGVKRYQISLDGPREVHNISRIRGDGSGTFDHIWNNLIAIRDSSEKVSIILRIHYSVNKLELLFPLLKEIQEEFIQDSRFSVIFEPIKRLGGSNDESIDIFSPAEEESANDLLRSKLYGQALASTERLNTRENHVCYASRPNSLVIRANGDVGKCTVALNDPRNKVGSIREDGELEMLPGRIVPWIRGIESLEPSVLACPLNNLPSLNI